MDIRTEKIILWLLNKTKETNVNGFVVGVSGGIDSALTSTLCALTGKKTIVVGLPIHQESSQVSRSQKHMDWLCEKFGNVEQITFNLTETFDIFQKATNCNSELAIANARSRLRMVALYSVANQNNLLVAGTGNKIEDYGIGFFTKYGDGGVDISPIADLLKSEVRELARQLGVIEEIINAVPTDGLWGDNRSDEDQIGATYDELEWALKYNDNNKVIDGELSDRQKEVLKIYTTRHIINKHKLEPPPICYIEEE
jgi:NAD+ synthase